MDGGESENETVLEQEMEEHKKYERRQKKEQTKLANNYEAPPITVSVDFAVALQQARIAKNWSQKQLASQMNVKQNDVIQWEKINGTKPSSAQHCKLNRLLQTTLPKN